MDLLSDVDGVMISHSKHLQAKDILRRAIASELRRQLGVTP